MSTPTDAIAYEIQMAQKDVDIAVANEADAHARTLACRQRVADLQAIQTLIVTTTPTATQKGKSNA